jgi:regulator of nucleoside diphosphate kinase
MGTNRRIVLTMPDVERLRAILGARSGSLHDRAHLRALEDELERAIVVGADQIAADVVTLHSQVLVRDIETGALREYTLVSPVLANLASGHISVLAPLGTALLGYRQGDEVVWEMPGGLRRLRIEKVMQPPHSPLPGRPGHSGRHSHSPAVA